MIIDIKPSKKAYKRYQVTMDNGEKYDFGSKHGSTYIDHHDKEKRNNYWARHTANSIEHQLIYNLVPSPSLFSAYLLWGHFKHIDNNIIYLNQKLKEEHQKFY
jgi:hypothetical protein